MDHNVNIHECKQEISSEKLISPNRGLRYSTIIDFESQLARWLKSNQHVYMLRHQEIQYIHLLIWQQEPAFQ